MDINLRRATLADIDDYLRIEGSVASRLTVVATETGEAEEDITRRTVYMIDTQDGTVGIISYELEAGGRSAYLNEVAIDAAHQGKGIGKAALRLVMLELFGVKRVHLVTHPENPARHLYAKFGFVPTSVRIEDYCGSGEPRIEMERVV